MNRLVVWSLLLLLAFVFAPQTETRAVFAAEPEEESSEASDSASDSSAESDADSPNEEKPAEADKAEGESADEADDEADEAEASDEEEADDDDEAEASDEEEADDDEKESPKRKTFTIEKKPLKLEASIDGILVARTMTEVVLDAEQWSSFEIEEVVPHGAEVKEGEVLARFDGEELNEAIADLELTQRIKEIAFTKKEEDFPRLEESLARRLKVAQRSWDQSQEDYKQYTDTERELVVKSQNMRLKRAKFNLQYSKDELDQLKKMYEADDLTEETEEMILSRQKTTYEFAQFSYEIAKYSNEMVMSTTLPRQDVRMKEAQRAVELALERAKQASQLDLNRARYELEQARIQRRKDNEKHAELVADKGLLTVKSPAAGVVYYGRCVKGKWGEVNSLITKMQPEKKVPKGAVMMTIVEPAVMYVLGSVGEKDLPSIKQGQSAKLAPKAEGVEPIDARVASIDSVPVGGGKFGIEVDITGEVPEWLVPGMTGKVKIVTYKKKDALLAPTAAVHTDEESGSKFVWVVRGEGKEAQVEKETVKTGRTKGKNVEVLEGLAEGDVISLDPDEEGTAGDEEDKQ